MDFEIQLPEEITNLMNGGGLPSPEMMNFYVDEKDRIFFIDFEIDQSLIEIERKILQYNRIDKDTPVEQRKPIKLFIYSYGGELDAMFGHSGQCDLYKHPERSALIPYMEHFRGHDRTAICELNTNHRGWISTWADALEC